MKLKPVQSRMLSDAGYDEKNHELGVIFNSGDMYIYENVPRSKYDALMKAESIGTYMHKYIIDVHPYRRMNRTGVAPSKERKGHQTAQKTAPKGKVIPFRQKRDVSP